MALREKLIRLAHEKPEMREHLLPMIKEARISPSNFWGFIDQMGWGKKTTDYKKLKQHLMAKLTVEQASDFDTLFSKAKEQLGNAIEKWERKTGKSLGVGDDSFDDLRSHIIGLGRKEFQQVLKDPELAYNRAQASDFTESFSYAIPSKYDYEKEMKRPGAGGDMWPDGAVLWYADFPKNMVTKYQQFLQDVQIQAGKIKAAQAQIEALEQEMNATLQGGMKVSDAFKTYMRKNSPKGSKVELAYRGFPDRAWRSRSRVDLITWVNDLSQTAKQRLNATKNPRDHKSK